jgi:hypothetical protein
MERVADFVRVWAKKHFRALGRVVARVLSEPPGTTFTVPPFSFVAFKTETARQSHQAAVYRAVKERAGVVRNFQDERSSCCGR